MNLKSPFLDHLTSKYPRLNRETLSPLISENLLSPFTIELPASVLEQAKQAVSTLFRLRENPLYRQDFSQELSARELQDPGNKSICMSYDFHLAPDQNLKLIEVNTNASFLALGYEMYQMRSLPLPQRDFSLEELRKNIEQELSLQGKTPTSKLRVSIIDEKPEEQRLYSEFLVFNEMFLNWGWDSKIQDFRECDPDQVDFIYNRHTDFFLESPESLRLRKAYLDKTTCLSPNPYEYFLLADKQRMIDWWKDGALDRWEVPKSDQDLIRTVVPTCIDMDENRREEIWQQRKKFFFKPKRAFGAKQSYRGASISQKAFGDIIGHDFIAQEFIPAPELTFEGITFKYDLRCYAYQGRLQSVVARLYQGQVTNLKTPLGGFACVLFK